jgi:hypothetical protein
MTPFRALISVQVFVRTPKYKKKTVNPISHTAAGKENANGCLEVGKILTIFVLILAVLPSLDKVSLSVRVVKLSAISSFVLGNHEYMLKIEWIEIGTKSLKIAIPKKTKKVFFGNL